MQNIYRLALQVQDASNISGVIHSLSREVIPAIREEAGFKELGNPYMEQHPALLLFLDKIVSLTHVGWIHDMDMQIGSAYTKCKELADAQDSAEAELAAGLRDNAEAQS